MRITQSVLVIFNGYSTAVNADGIPLDTYTPAAAQTMVAISTQRALSRSIISLLCVLVLMRYRSAITFMFVLLLLNYPAGKLIFQFVPSVSTGTSPASTVNLIMFALMIIGLALSLRGRNNLQGQD